MNVDTQAGSTAKLRVNFVLPRPSLAGGIKSNRLIGEALARRGHQVCMIYPTVDRPLPPVWRMSLFVRRLRNRMASWGGWRHHLEHAAVDVLPIRRRTVTAADAPDADVTIATWWETMEWIRDWPASKGVRAYFIRHDESTFGGDPERVRATYRQPVLKLVIARWLQRLMRETYNDPHAVLVPNGIDWSQFSVPSRPRPTRPTVGFMHGYQALKGCDTAIEALRLVQERIPELHVVMFGASEKPAAASVFRSAEYHFEPDQRLIPQLYAKCHCWLMPSVLEGLGMPGLEAAACWCPLVVTRSGGPEDYLEDGRNGYLVDIGDARGMADAILHVLQAPDGKWREMSAASHEIAQRFNWDMSAAKLEAALVAAVGKRRSETAVAEAATRS